MRIFVAGGAGYVGSHCVRDLLNTGHQVTVLDNLTVGHRAAVDPRAQFVRGDVGDAQTLTALLGAAGFDAVMHFAGATNVGESVEAPLLHYRNNIACTINLLEAMQKSGVRRIVFSSTCAVYGEAAELPLVETMPTRPINPYGRTKLAIEWMLHDCAAAWGLGAVALRYFNAAGAAADGAIGEDHRPETHLIPIVLQVALGQRTSVKVYGADYPTPDGSCVRDYVHVEDLAAAHTKALENVRSGAAEVYNVGTGHGHSVLAVIEMARKVTRHPIPADVVGRRPGDPPVLFANPQKVRRAYSWSPRFESLETIVQSAWNWHERHPRGFLSE